jgi:hypothetical protein
VTPMDILAIVPPPVSYIKGVSIVTMTSGTPSNQININISICMLFYAL